MLVYNPDYPQDNVCRCGHLYHRHFDSYEDWVAIGCKYCGCGHFVHVLNAERLSPFERMQHYGQWNAQLEDYVVQWEMFGYVVYPTLHEYLGATLAEWEAITKPTRTLKSSEIDNDEWVDVL